MTQPLSAPSLDDMVSGEFIENTEKLCPAPRYADLFSRYRHNDRRDCHGDEAPNVLRRSS